MPSISKRCGAGGVADIVEVGYVLPPARTHFCAVAAGRIGSLLEAGEHILELHHARIGEHQVGSLRARVGWTHDLMTVLAEIVEEHRPDFIHALILRLSVYTRRQPDLSRLQAALFNPRLVASRSITSRLPPPSRRNHSFYRPHFMLSSGSKKRAQVTTAASHASMRRLLPITISAASSPSLPAAILQERSR